MLIVLTGRAEAQRTTVRGGLDLYHIHSRTPPLVYRIDELEVAFPDPPPERVSGSVYEVTGTIVDGVLHADGYRRIAGIGARVAPVRDDAIGDQRLLIVPVNWRQNRAQPFTIARLRDAGAELDRFVVENSYDQARVVYDVVSQWIELSLDTTGCTLGGAATPAETQEAAVAAAALGYPFANYSHIMFVFPFDVACRFNGIATVGIATAGRSGSWINGTLNARVLAHEFGHQLGLWHSHSYRCSGGAVVGCPFVDGVSVFEYGGGLIDTMGGSAYGHYNTFHKERLRWIAPAQEASTDGMYMLSAVALSPAAHPRALKLLRREDPEGNEYYYFELRQPVGYDASLSGGIYANLVTDSAFLGTQNGQPRSWHSDNSAMLLDLRPTGSGASLWAGGSYGEPLQGWELRVVAVDRVARTATLEISGLSTAPPPPPPPPPPRQCVRSEPSVTLSREGGTTVAPGQFIDLTVRVVNNDSKDCEPTTFKVEADVSREDRGDGRLDDSFDRPSSSNLGTAWTEISGDWSISGDAVQGPAEGLLIATGLTGETQAVAADFLHSRNYSGTLCVVLRYQDPDNYYSVCRSQGGVALLRILKRVNGLETLLATAAYPNPPANVAWRLEGRARGDTIEAFISGAMRLATRDQTFASGGVGYRSATTAPSYVMDNASVGVEP
jgi:hypothetical protein